MAMSSIISGVVLLVSLPPLYFSITSSGLLMHYEEKTKKAAQYSNEAERQLHKTRTTQSSAVMASVASTISATCLIFTRPSTSTSAILATVNAAACLGARMYVADFWKGCARIPGAGDYNDAVRATEQAITWLGGLTGAWIGYAGYLGLFGA
ncbi:hypothetical protein PMZ80_011049 [Knufia obscura]|uniref:Uncharacterized protein n=2 Tax=Knufia TaxID=430999 RepID=A0AAN8E8N5_9EURO|nr:hypothetical protein PMZ80_011049 [Knufia obscura]KAK5948198.1 hypothetical protein OHC33_010746 [Knufia fluminis]